MMWRPLGMRYGSVRTWCVGGCRGGYSAVKAANQTLQFVLPRYAQIVPPAEASPVGHTLWVVAHLVGPESACDVHASRCDSVFFLVIVAFSDRPQLCQGCRAYLTGI